MLRCTAPTDQSILTCNNFALPHLFRNSTSLPLLIRNREISRTLGWSPRKIGGKRIGGGGKIRGGRACETVNVKAATLNAEEEEAVWMSRKKGENLGSAKIVQFKYASVGGSINSYHTIVNYHVPQRNVLFWCIQKLILVASNVMSTPWHCMHRTKTALSQIFLWAEKITH